jgi:hypothetical protein
MVPQHLVPECAARGPYGEFGEGVPHNHVSNDPVWLKLPLLLSKPSEKTTVSVALACQQRNTVIVCGVFSNPEDPLICLLLINGGKKKSPFSRPWGTFFGGLSRVSLRKETAFVFMKAR